MIRHKNKMFKRLQNHHNNLALNEEYKAYRNTLNRLLRLAKQIHYHNILNEHKGNSKKAWKFINELAFDQKKTVTFLTSPPTCKVTFSASPPICKITFSVSPLMRKVTFATSPSICKVTSYM